MITITPESILPGMVVFFRASGLFLLMPGFSSVAVPVPVRVALAALISYLVGSAAPPAVEMPGHWIMLMVLIFHELLAGLLLGLAGRILFAAVEFAGQVIATEMGLMMSASMDPFTRSSSSPPGTLLFSFATVLFFATGSHHWCLVAFVRSFEAFPPGSAFDSRTADLVIAQSGRIFLLALQLAAPVLAMGFLVNIAFAILGRAAPSINAFQQSFPVRILAGLSVLGMTCGLAAYHLLGELRALPELMLRFVR